MIKAECAGLVRGVPNVPKRCGARQAGAGAELPGLTWEEVTHQ